MSPDPLLSVTDVASLLGVTVKVVHDRRRTLPPARRVDGRLCWLRSDIEGWLASRGDDRPGRSDRAGQGGPPVPADAVP